jgi:hypothetical protein
MQFLLIILCKLLCLITLNQLIIEWFNLQKKSLSERLQVVRRLEISVGFVTAHRAPRRAALHLATNLSVKITRGS